MTECQEIIAYGKKLPSYEGRMADARGGYRRSTVAWIDPAQDASWLYEKLAKTFRAVNRWYQFDIVGFAEMLQFTVYKAGGRFDWHMDSGGVRMSRRKLSLSLQLTDGDRYTGGQLEFCGLGPLSHSREIGTVIVFPSFLAHRVTRLASGTRHALVAWAHGPGFR